MRVPLGWLAEWVDLPGDRTLLEERLTVGGLEIEAVHRTGPGLDGLVVGHVLERGRHPDADRLSLCRVDLGGGGPVEIVCGAPNVAAGQRVAVAPVGTALPDGTKIRRSKIRGVTSQGMICSARELGLGGDHEGILVLETDAAPGTPLEDVLRVGETVLEVEITPNRGDWVSMLGMAREVRAQLGGGLRLPETVPDEGPRGADEDVAVRIEDREGCPRYVARVVRDVRVGPSPAWLRERLEAAGLRSVNNVVDVTNLVMLEFGQPLHAFDLDALHGRSIAVRAAREGEKLLTLDGQTRELDTRDLVIADERGAVAIAGVMGGAETEVGEATRNLLLESAHFEASRVRRTARRLGLHSDASYRFERGVDREGQRRAADRAARLIGELCGGRVSRGAVQAVGAPPAATEEILLEVERVRRLLGVELATAEITALLERLEIAVRHADEGVLACRPPSYRNDLHRPVDLVEEVARIHGYDRLAPTLPAGRPTGIHEPPARRWSEAARTGLVAAGLVELMTFPGVPPSDDDALGLAAEDPRRRHVGIVNPVQAADSVLRTTLVPSVLRVVRSNLSRQVERLRVFEIGRTFRAGERAEDLPDEGIQAVAAFCEGDGGSLWERGDVPVFFRAKGVAERLFADLGVEAVFRPGAEEPWLHPGVAGRFEREGRALAVVGELHPDVAARFEIGAPTALVAVDLGALVGPAPAPPQLREVSVHPRVRRDLAVLLDRDVRAGEVLEVIRQQGGASLAVAEIFDRWEGKGVPEGKVSLAFRLDFQRTDRTLTDAEVAKATERVVKLLEKRFGGELR